MGQLRFHIPSSLDARTKADLALGYIAALPDYMPWPTTCRFEDDLFIVEKEPAESGSLYVPWPIDVDKNSTSWLAGASHRLITGTATLGERADTYHLLTELARGKVNQVRNQAADWQGAGLPLSESLVQALRQTSLSFAHTVCQPNDRSGADRLGSQALMTAFQTGESLIDAYIEHVLANRKNTQGKLPLYLSCGLEAPLTGEAEELFLKTFNAVRIPFNWKLVEPRESSYQWDRYDALVAWARQNKLQIEGGPLVDLTPNRLPSWLDQNKGDAQSLANLLLDYLEATLVRYKNDIAFWTLLANAHDTSQFAIDDEDQIWLNAQILAAAKQIHAEGRFTVSLSQPWAEHLARGDRMYSAFVFADALLRSRVELIALNLECAMGWNTRGSYLRDFIETSRMLDLYALFGAPLTMYIGMPSSSARIDAGYAVLDDGNPWSPELQARWAVRMLGLAACKPYTLSVSWLHWTDAQDHLFAHGGMLDTQGNPKPVLTALQQFRDEHLRTP